MNLTEKKCVACEGDTPPLKKEEIQTYLPQLKTEWQVVDPAIPIRTGGQKIKKEFKFKDFKKAMVFVNKIADLAEAEGHHPDIYIFYNRVSLELWTHAVGGLSENDFIMAAKVDGIL